MQPLKTKIELQGYIHWVQESWNPDGRFEFFRNNDMTEFGYAMVCPHTLVVELPAEFHPAKAHLASLEAQKRQLAENFNARIHQINEQIKNLQCLEFQSEATIPGMEERA